MSRGAESRKQQPYVSDRSARANRALGLFQGRKLKDSVIGGTGTHNLGTLLTFHSALWSLGPQDAQMPIYLLCRTRDICSAAIWIYV